jgi:hypothetical protein
MNNLFNLIIDWAEVWALLIPICVFFYKKKISSLLKPVVWYVFIALFLNLAQDIIWKYKIELKLTGFLYNNPFIYNTHSIERFALFSLFFIRLKQPILSRIKTILPFVFFLFIIINFSVYQSFTEFSSRTLGTETAFLLLYCLLYYLNLLNQDTTIAFKHLPDFWVVTGLSIYVVINFPIFLFYRALSNQFEKFAIDIWNVHNITYIIFCVFLARAFYVSKN